MAASIGCSKRLQWSSAATSSTSSGPRTASSGAVVRKTETIEEQLGSLSPVFESRLEKLMSQGISRKGVDELEKAVDATGAATEQRAEVEEELEAARERDTALGKQLETVRTLLKKSETAIQFNKDAFRDALTCALDRTGRKPSESPASLARSSAMPSRLSTSEAAPTTPGWRAWTSSEPLGQRVWTSTNGVGRSPSAQ